MSKKYLECEFETYIMDVVTHTIVLYTLRYYIVSEILNNENENKNSKNKQRA